MWMTNAYIILGIFWILMLFTKQKPIVKAFNFIIVVVTALIIYIRFETGHIVSDLPKIHLFDGLSNWEIVVWLGSALLLTIVVYKQIIKLRDRG